MYGSLSPSSFGPCFSSSCSGFFFRVPSWVGGASSRRLVFFSTTGGRQTGEEGTDCNVLCVVSFLFFLVFDATGGAVPPRRLGEYKLTLLRLNSSCLTAFHKAWHPQAILSICFFFWFLLGLVALFFLSSGWVGRPLPCFPLPPGPCGVSFFWVGWVPLPCFPGVFPMVLGWVGARFFCFSCYLLLLASFSLLQLGKHGLPTRKPPGPPRPFPWCVCPHPSPAGSRRADAPR